MPQFHRIDILIIRDTREIFEKVRSYEDTVRGICVQFRKSLHAHEFFLLRTVRT